LQSPIAVEHEPPLGYFRPAKLAVGVPLDEPNPTLPGEEGAIHGDAFDGGIARSCGLERCLRSETIEFGAVIVVGVRTTARRPAGLHARGHPRSNFASAFQVQAVCPPQELPAPAVQPKQCRAVTMERACQLSSLKLEMCAPSGIAI
jgi:hypothetical protein